MSGEVVCPSCNEPRGSDEFAWKDKAHTRRHAACNKCRYERERKYQADYAKSPNGVERHVRYRQANSERYVLQAKDRYRRKKAAAPPAPAPEGEGDGA